MNKIFHVYQQKSRLRSCLFAGVWSAFNNGTKKMFKLYDQIVLVCNEWHEKNYFWDSISTDIWTKTDCSGKVKPLSKVKNLNSCFIHENKLSISRTELSQTSNISKISFENMNYMLTSKIPICTCSGVLPQCYEEHLSGNFRGSSTHCGVWTHSSIISTSLCG